MSGLATAPSTAPEVVQVVFWAIGVMIAAIGIGGSMTWWISRQHTQTRKDLYTKINIVQRELDSKITGSKETCTDTKERVGLLEQSHNHLEKRIDGIDIKMDNMQIDVTAIKENFSQLQQKQSENHLTLVGEIRNVSNSLIIKQLQQNKE